MANRVMIFGFERGTFLDAQPTTGALTVDAAAARSGDYGLLLSAVSGASSSLTINMNTSPSYNVLFTRIYVQVKALPSSARAIWRGGAIGSANSSILKLNPDGTVELSHATSGVTGTSSTALAVDRWYRLEVGQDRISGMHSLRINGAVEVDWAACGTLTSDLSFIVGALDTVASTMTIWFDDFAADTTDWCSFGRIEKIDPNTLAADNANWTLAAGADKLSAINEAVPDDDTSYILSPNNTTDEIIFGFEPCPALSVAPRAVCGWIRVKGDAASASFGIRSRANYPSAYINGATTVIFSQTNTSYGWQKFALGALTNVNQSASVLAGQWSNDEISQLFVGIKISVGTNRGRVSNLFLEVEYDDRAAAIVDPNRMFLADFEGSLTSENAWSASGNTSGSAAISSTQFKTGANALRINPGNGAAGYWQAASYSPNSGGQHRASTGFWLYVAARPTSGAIDIWSDTENVTKALGLRMDSSGGVAMFSNGADGSFSAADTIPLAEWVYVQIVWRRASAAAASDAMFTVWIDGVMVIDDDAVTMAAISSSILYRYGTVSNASGGCDLYYDTIIIDNGRSLPTRDRELVTLHPNGAGSETAAAFAVTGAATKWEAIDESGTHDSDTTYVATSDDTADDESWALENLPGEAQRAYCVFVYGYVKRDGGTNGLINMGLINGLTVSTADYSGGVLSTSAYAVVGYMARQAQRRGRWTTSLVDTAEVYLKEGSTTNRSRLTQIAAVVEFSSAAERGSENASSVQIVG